LTINTLILAARTQTTFFLLINDDQSLAGSKVLSFDWIGKKQHPMVRQLYGINDTILPDVQVWKQEIAVAAELSNDDDQTYTSGKQD
jgi:hypothetical protein